MALPDKLGALLFCLTSTRSGLKRGLSIVLVDLVAILKKQCSPKNAHNSLHPHDNRHPVGANLASVINTNAACGVLVEPFLCPAEKSLDTGTKILQ